MHNNTKMIFLFKQIAQPQVIVNPPPAALAYAFEYYPQAILVTLPLPTPSAFFLEIFHQIRSSI
jgi:hypothetical protein